MADEPKVWKLEGKLVIEHGVDLLEKMASLGVGEGVLQIGWDKFKPNEDGEIEDVPAHRLAKVFLNHQYGVDGDYHVLDHHKDMVKQLCETGEYVPTPVEPATITDKFKLVKKPGVKAAEVKKVEKPAK
jgi:hypothetical protein